MQCVLFFEKKSGNLLSRKVILHYWLFINIPENQAPNKRRLISSNSFVSLTRLNIKVRSKLRADCTQTRLKRLLSPMLAAIASQ